MSKKSNNKEKVLKKDYGETIIKVPLEDLFGESFGRYSKYVILGRAIPDVRDGLKPVQRRILYSMYEEGNKSTSAYRKSAKSVGAIMGNYHPHGDSSIYEAMIRMSQDWKVRNVLIDMHGNNGSIDGDSAAAYRYTETRLTPLAESLLKDIEKGTVDMVLNFDDTEEEPSVLPSSFPNLLVNGASGIAAGYACEIPTHNLKEIVEGAILLISKPKSTLEDLMKIIKGPDFPGGGIIQGLDGIKKAYETGRGRIVLRSVVEVEKLKGGRLQLVVTEIPYNVNKSTLVKKIDGIRIDKTIDGIQEVRDESNREGIRLVIELRKDTSPDLICNYLYKHTDLQINYNFNMVSIADNSPKLLGLKSILEYFIEHRVDVVTRRTKRELEIAEKRLHIVEGLIKAIENLDSVVKIIKDSKNKTDAKLNLEKKYKFTPIQSEAIVTLQLYRLTNTDISELEKEKDGLEKLIKVLEGYLTSKVKMNNLIKKELEEIKTVYGDARRSLIQEEVEEIVVDMSQVIVEEDVVVSITRDGYVKRTGMRSYTTSGGESENGIKDGDEVVLVGEHKTTNTLLAFTNKGNYVYLPVHLIEDTRWKDQGKHISTYAQLGSGEFIVNAFILDGTPEDVETTVTIIKDSGLIKRSLLTSYVVQRFGRAYEAVKVSEDEEVLGVWLTEGNSQIVITTKDGYGIHFGEDEVNATGIKTAGMRGIHLREGDKAVSAHVVRFKKDVTDLQETIGEVKENPRGRKGTKVKKVKKVKK